MKKEELKQTVKEIIYWIETSNNTQIANTILYLHYVDLAEIIHHLSEKNRKYIFELLDADTASQVLSELDNFVRNQFVEDLDTNRISEIVDEMDSDDATDFISQLPKGTATKVLNSIDVVDSSEVRELLSYPEDTAGGIMAKEFIAVEENSTIRDAIHTIRAKSNEVRDVYYIFVVDKNGVLIGFLSIKKLILTSRKEKVTEVMNREVVSVNTNLDQEEVANIVRKYDLVSIPVVDNNGVLVGRITIDDIIDVVDKEATEDIHKMAGINEDEELRDTSSVNILKTRLPWLITGLLGGIVAAVVLSSFEHSFNQIIMLSFFTPVVMAMGGSISIQSSTLVVRGLATGEITFIGIYKHIFKEMKVALLNGMACSSILVIIAGIWTNWNMGILLGAALFLIINIAGLIGTVIPLIFKKINIDPALATGPFITIINDIIGLIIYLTAANIFIKDIA